MALVVFVFATMRMLAEGIKQTLGTSAKVRDLIGRRTEYSRG